MTNEICELEILLQEQLVNVSAVAGWVNGKLYEDSNEFIGVLPIPIELQEQYGMQTFNTSLPSHQHQKHLFLAERQNTRRPVLPIVEPAEKQLFHRLLGQDKDFQYSSTTNWRLLQSNGMIPLIRPQVFTTGYLFGIFARTCFNFFPFYVSYLNTLNLTSRVHGLNPKISNRHYP
jgi:hypothetical protein